MAVRFRVSTRRWIVGPLPNEVTSSVARLQPSVVPLSADEVSQVAALWVQRRVESGGNVDAARRAVDEGLFLEAVTRPSVTIFGAFVEGELLGYAWVTSHMLTPHMDVPTMAVDDLYVAPGSRSRGVARAMLTAVAARAQKVGIDHVTASSPVQDKPSGRALTRMGFASVTTRRIAQTSMLLRRLRGPEPRGGVDQLVLQRRRRAQKSRVDAEPVAATS